MACPVLYWKTLKHVSKLLCQTQFKIFLTIHREININYWEWEIVAWEKEITMRDYRLVFLNRWATACQRSVFLSKWRNNCAEDFKEFVYSPWSTIERYASVYHSSDHFVLGSLKNTQKCLSPLITVLKFLFRPVWDVRIVFSRLIKKDVKYSLDTLQVFSILLLF